MNEFSLQVGIPGINLIYQCFLELFHEHIRVVGLSSLRIEKVKNLLHRVASSFIEF